MFLRARNGEIFCHARGHIKNFACAAGKILEILCGAVSSSSEGVEAVEQNVPCGQEHLGNSRNRERKSGKKFSRFARKILDPREKNLAGREKFWQILEILELFGNF